MSRINKQIFMMFVDSFMIVLIITLSFIVRLGDWFSPDQSVLLLILFSPVIAIPIFMFFGLYRSLIRYVSFRAMWSITKAVSLYAIVWGLICFMLAIDGIPRSVIIINWFLSLTVFVGLRFSARWFVLQKFDTFNQYNPIINIKKVLIYGAGSAGIQLMSALKHSFEYEPIGFVDDLKELHGNFIGGLEVYGVDIIGEVITKNQIDEVLIAMPSASRTRRQEIYNVLDSYPVMVRILPGMSDLAGGKVSVNDLRKLSIEDLLDRDKVLANQKLLSKNITLKVVMVTGAGGSIGSELCRQILLLKPKTLILYEMNELALYEIENKLTISNNEKINIHAILGSVNNANRLDRIFKRFKVETVYHAAAYKHVPIVEFNNSEGVENNIFGTLNCSKVAIKNKVQTFVLISTDKAVRPSNTMGATKRVAELILQALSTIQNRTQFTMVRFGNVMDSSGSVIPLFKKQIKNGGPLTITHKEIIRYFMTISEAVELVIQAGAMGTGGDVFVLNMGKPIKIESLARKIIKLSGLELKDDLNPNGDIEIKYTGLRPGEKLYEELLIGDNVSETENINIMRAEEDMLSWKDLEPLLNDLKKEIYRYDQNKVRKILLRIVPNFKPQCDIKDILY